MEVQLKFSHTPTSLIYAFAESEVHVTKKKKELRFTVEIVKFNPKTETNKRVFKTAYTPKDFALWHDKMIAEEGMTVCD